MAAEVAIKCEGEAQARSIIRQQRPAQEEACMEPDFPIDGFSSFLQRDMHSAGSVGAANGPEENVMTTGGFTMHFANNPYLDKSRRVIQKVPRWSYDTDDALKRGNCCILLFPDGVHCGDKKDPIGSGRRDDIWRIRICIVMSKRKADGIPVSPEVVREGAGWLFPPSHLPSLPDDMTKRGRWASS